MRPFLRTLLLAGLGCALVALLVVVLLGLALSAGWQRERLRDALVAQLSQRLGSPVRIEGIEGPLYPHVILRGVELPLGPDGVLRATSVSLRASVRRLWTERVLVLEEVQVEGADLLLPSAGAASEPGVPEEGASAGAKLAVALELRSARGRGRLRTQEQVEGAALAAGFGLSLQGLRIDSFGAAPRPRAADVELELEPTTVGSLRITGGALVATLRGDVLELARAELQTEAGALRARGRAQLEALWTGADPIEVRLDGDVEALDVGHATGVPELRSRLSGDFGAALSVPPHGGLAAAGVELSAELRDEAGDPRLETLLFRGRLRGGEWTLESAAVRGAVATLSATGSGSFERIETLELEAEIPSLGPFARAFRIEGAPASGRLELHASLAGPFGSPTGRVDLVATGLRPPPELARAAALELGGQSIPLGRAYPRALRARAALEAGSVALEDLLVETRVGALSGHGRIELAHDGRLPSLAALELEGRVRGLDLGALTDAEELRSQLAGTLRARAVPSPDARAVDALDLDLALRGPDALVHALRLDGSLRAGAWTLREAEVSARSLSLRARGAGSAARVERLALQAEFDDVEPFARLLGVPGEPRGRLELDAELAGSPRMPIGRVSARGEGLELAGRSLGAVQLALSSAEPGVIQLDGLSARGGALDLEAAPGAELRLSRERLELRGLSLASGVQLLRARGVLAGNALAHAQLSDAQLDVERLDPATVAGVLGGPSALGGELFASIALEGRLVRPRLTGAVTWERPQIEGTELERIHAQIATRGDAWIVTGHVEAAERLVARADLRAPRPPVETDFAAIARDPATSLALRADELDLALLAPLAPRWLRDPRGRATVEVRARGGSPPTIGGTLRVSGASVRVPATGQTYTPIAIDIEFADDRIVVRELTAGPPEGAARVTGSVQLRDFVPGEADLQLVLDGFGLARARRARVHVDGRATLAGPLDGLVLDGELALRAGRLSPPEGDDPIFREIRILGADADGAPLREGLAPDPFARATMRLAVEVPRGTWIVGRGAELEVAGRVQVERAPGAPVRYTGELEVVRGTYRFQRRRMQVQRGTASFAGDAELDPQLDVLATTRVRDVDLRVALTGRLSDLRIELSSEPPRERAEIVSLLLLGRPLDEVDAERASGLEASLAGAGAQLALDELRERVGGYLPFDTADVDLGDGGNGGRVELGRYLADDVFVRYGRTIGEEGADDVRVEWRLSRSLSVESSVSTDGETGADVLWRRDY